AHVNGEMRSRITPREAVIKAFQVVRQLRLQATNLFGIHALASGRELDRPNLRRYSCGRQDQLSAVVVEAASCRFSAPAARRHGDLAATGISATECRSY